MPPETRYARSGDVSIAYQVVGRGPRDLVVVPGWVTNIEVFWEDPGYHRLLDRLASFSRLILFDKRGTGLSDRAVDMPTLEVRMDDVRAVMDAVGSQSAALFGYSEGGPMCGLFAATYPERTSSLIMASSYARRTRTHDHPWGPSDTQMQAFIDSIQHDWGGAFAVDARAPSLAHDERFRQWWARFLRMSAGPAAAAALQRMNAAIDIRHVLPSIRVPTLVLHSVNDKVADIDAARYLAAQIPGAKMVELTGDHLPWGNDGDRIADEIEEFLTGDRPVVMPDRVLATVMFTDIVSATAKAAGLGDRRWRELLESHHALVRKELSRFRGREIDTAGDGFLASFDGPARAVQCARAIGDAVRSLGIELRAGVHTGECEVMGEKLGGIAVHIGSRIAAQASPGEVLVSSTVKDLVAGSGLSFLQRGAHVLKGVPGEWHIYAVA